MIFDSNQYYCCGLDCVITKQNRTEQIENGASLITVVYRDDEGGIVLKNMTPAPHPLCQRED
jgi:hypothetical protein